MPTPLDTSYTVTIGGVPCYDEDLQEHYERARSYALRTVRCLWADRITLINNLMPYVASVLGANVYVSGDQYPDAPWMYLKSTEVKGEGTRFVGSNGMVAYDWAVLRLRYEPPEWTFGNPFEIGSIELDFESDCTALSQDQASLVWASDGSDVPPSIVPYYREQVCNFTQSRTNVAALPVSTILSLVGCMNSSSIFGANPGQVYFLGARARRVIAIGGRENYSVDYSFKYRKRTWDTFFNPDASGGQGDFDTVAFNDSAQTPYVPSGDLNQLFAS